MEKNIFFRIMLLPVLLLDLSCATTARIPASVPETDFYRCEDFNGVGEYDAEIDINKGKADVFDGDATSSLTLKSIQFPDTLPAQRIFVFEGKDQSGPGIVRLSFNLTKRSALLESINNSGKIYETLKADHCVSQKP
jgi:hypothetical protein